MEDELGFGTVQDGGHRELLKQSVVPSGLRVIGKNAIRLLYSVLHRGGHVIAAKPEHAYGRFSRIVKFRR